MKGKGKIIPTSGRKRLTPRNQTPNKTGKVEYLNVWINTESVQLPKDFEKLEDDTIIDMKITVTDVTAKIRNVTYGSYEFWLGGNALATFTSGIIYNNEKQGILIKINGGLKPTLSLTATKKKLATLIEKKQSSQTIKITLPITVSGSVGYFTLSKDEAFKSSLTRAFRKIIVPSITSPSGNYDYIEGSGDGTLYMILDKWNNISSFPANTTVNIGKENKIILNSEFYEDKYVNTKFNNLPEGLSASFDKINHVLFLSGTPETKSTEKFQISDDNEQIEINVEYKYPELSTNAVASKILYDLESEEFSIDIPISGFWKGTEFSYFNKGIFELIESFGIDKNSLSLTRSDETLKLTGNCGVTDWNKIIKNDIKVYLSAVWDNTVTDKNDIHEFVVNLFSEFGATDKVVDAITIDLSSKKLEGAISQRIFSNTYLKTAFDSKYTKDEEYKTLIDGIIYNTKTGECRLDENADLSSFTEEKYTKEINEYCFIEGLGLSNVEKAKLLCAIPHEITISILKNESAEDLSKPTTKYIISGVTSPNEYFNGFELANGEYIIDENNGLINGEYNGNGITIYNGPTVKSIQTWDEYGNTFETIVPNDTQYDGDGQVKSGRFSIHWSMNYAFLVSPYGTQIAHATCSSNECLSTVKWEFNEPFTGTLKVTRG